MVEVLLQMNLTWLEVEVVLESEEAKKMELIKDVAIGAALESRFWDELLSCSP